MVLPAVVLLLVALIHTALLGADLITAQGVAREAARVAAVGDDEAVRAAVTRAVGSRPFQVDLQPPDGRRAGDLVTATLRLRSRAFASFGIDVWLPARATMRVEARP